MKRKSLTYKKAGVDVAGAENLIKKIKQFARTTKTSKFSGSEIGGFGAVFDLSKMRFKKPVLVSSTDGVGTKLKIAFLANKHNTVGIDLVAMNVNDIITTGAVPLFFLDYIATGKLDRKVLSNVVKGISKGCKLAGCNLIGGETAEMPGFYKKGEYDLAGFCVGAVEKDKILRAEDVEVEDTAIGIASSGLHSNGYSLVRKVFSQKEQKLLAKQLLTPTQIYAKPIGKLLEKFNSASRRNIKSMAHITGGAFYQKAVKVLPKGKQLNIYKNTWPVPEIFKLVQKAGGIEEKEMFATFNMGVGFILIAKRNKAKDIISYLKKFKLRSWVIGEVVKGKKEVVVI